MLPIISRARVEKFRFFNLQPVYDFQSMCTLEGAVPVWKHCGKHMVKSRYIQDEALLTDCRVSQIAPIPPKRSAQQVERKAGNDITIIMNK